MVGIEKRQGFSLGLHVHGYVCVCVCIRVPAYMSAHHMCLVPTEARKGSQISCYWSYRQLSAAIWVLGIEPKSSRRGASALKH